MFCNPVHQTDELSQPRCYLTQTAHAGLGSSASISLSVTACLFIQLELFESLELIRCVSAPSGGKDLCVQCLLLFFSFFFLLPLPNSDSFCAPRWLSACRANCVSPLYVRSLWEEDINATSRRRHRHVTAASPTAAVPVFICPFFLVWPFPCEFRCSMQVCAFCVNFHAFTLNHCLLGHGCNHSMRLFPFHVYNVSPKGLWKWFLLPYEFFCFLP